MSEGDAQRTAQEVSRLLSGNARFVDRFNRVSLQARPLSGLAILTCMDARISVKDIFGLRPGDANIIRNAGAVASDDAIRSLVISTQLLGTTGILVMGHTRCGLLGLDEAGLASRLERATGATSDIGFGSFDDLTDHVQRQVARVREQDWISAQDVRGLIYDVDTGRVSEVPA